MKNFKNQEHEIYELIRNSESGLTSRQMEELSGQRQAGARLDNLLAKRRGDKALVVKSGERVCSYTKETVAVFKAINPLQEYFKVSIKEITFNRKMLYVLSCALDPLNERLDADNRVKIINNITDAINKFNANNKENNTLRSVFMDNMCKDLDLSAIPLAENEAAIFKDYINKYYKLLKNKK